MKVAGTTGKPRTRRRLYAVPHGTVTGYQGGGYRPCRCPRCVECWRRYQAGRALPSVRWEDALQIIEQRVAAELPRECDRVVVLLGCGRQVVFPRSHPLAESMLRALVGAGVLCPSP